MLGNGELGFTADITGLQTFPEQYSPLAPLLTMAQWAWHSFPNPKGYTRGRRVDGRRGSKAAARNPLRVDEKLRRRRPASGVHLAAGKSAPIFARPRRASALNAKNGKPATFAALSQTHQHLDLWTGALTSTFVFDGEPVKVVTRVDTDRDRVLVEITSPLVANGRVGVDVRYPGVSTKINPDPEDWDHPRPPQDDNPFPIAGGDRPRARS